MKFQPGRKPMETEGRSFQHRDHKLSGVQRGNSRREALPVGSLGGFRCRNHDGGFPGMETIVVETGVETCGNLSGFGQGQVGTGGEFTLFLKPGLDLGNGSLGQSEDFRRILAVVHAFLNKS